ncbi:MAG: DUF452 family protein, partial [Muribaculaceae bacterium]|nr:DUF452 family protein [Muribaculaceae bacterium]
MTFELLQHTPGCNRLILIFTGWSASPDLHKDIQLKGWDIAVVHNYSDLDFDLGALDGYSTIWLFAWSLGIVAASHILPAEKITAAFAVNGTLNPVDDNEGIPVSIYKGTASNLDQRNLSKFLRRMSPDSETFKRSFSKQFSDEDIEDLREQLILLHNISNSLCDNLPWRKVFISKGDRIFPPGNMKQSWEKKKVETIEIEGAHYYPLEKIIHSVVPDTVRIASKFHSALDCYDRYATAQERVSDRLNSMIANHFSTPDSSILEIGPVSYTHRRAHEPRMN